LVSDVERHTSPRDETSGGHFQSARKRLVGQLGSGFLPANVGRVVDAALLARTPFFAGLDTAAVEAVASVCKRRDLKRNDILFREGEEANDLFVVERGRVAIANRSEDGRESLVALAETVFLDVPGRTAKRLLELAGDGDQFQLPVTQEELASMVGASRERVNKAISQFVRLGWLEQQDRIYRITNREQLTIRAR